MDGPGADGSASGNGERQERTDVEALRLARDESRAVLDHQVELLNEIDARAVRTVRLAGATLGVVVSTLGLAGPSLLSGAGVVVLLLTVVGVCSLLVCTLVGVGTYSVSEARFGVDDSFRDEVRAGSYDERTWLRDLLAAYDEWSGEMERTIERNGLYLLTAQLLLLSGISFLVTAIALSAVPTYT